MRKKMLAGGTALASLLGCWFAWQNIWGEHGSTPRERRAGDLPGDRSRSSGNSRRDPRAVSSPRAPDPDAEQPSVPLPSREFGDRDQPHTGGIPKIKPSPPAGPAPESQLFDDSPMGRLLRDYFTQLYRVGAEAERRSKELLEQLKQDPAEAAAMLTEQYRSLPENGYGLRETTVQTLSDLESHETLDSLNGILEDEIAYQQGNDDPHSDGFSADEGRVRYAALEGLEGLASKGNAQAEAILQDTMLHGHPTLRHQAAVSFVRAGPDPRARQAAAAAMLPESDRWMVNTTVMSEPDMPDYSPEMPTNRAHPDEPAKNPAKALPQAAPAGSSKSGTEP